MEPNNRADLAIVTMNQMFQNVSFYIFRWCLPWKTLVTIKKDELKYWELVWSLRIIIPKDLYLKFSENAAQYKNIRIFDSMIGQMYSCTLVLILMQILMQIRRYYYSRMKNEFILKKLSYPLFWKILAPELLLNSEN